MTALHRHQLARLTAAGWQRVLAAPWDDDARACLGLWAIRRLPLVVTRQPVHTSACLSLGLPAPDPWRGRRLALTVPHGDVEAFGEFPELADAALVSCRRPGDGTAWRALGAELHALGATARVYGSHGWQALTGLPHAHANSDLDLCVTVSDATQADGVASVLWRAGEALGPRLDGELAFPDGRAVPWREWRAWRAGHSSAVLCKTLTGACLVREPFAALAPVAPPGPALDRLAERVPERLAPRLAPRSPDCLPERLPGPLLAPSADRSPHPAPEPSPW